MTDQIRVKQLAKIHLLAKQAGLDEEAYRYMLRQVAGVDSAAKLDDAGRRKVLDHLRRQRGGGRGYPGRPHNLGSGADSGAQLAKVEALLAEAKRPWAYADGLARRMYGVERVAWCQPEQLRGLIAALMKDAQRHGRRTE